MDENAAGPDKAKPSASPTRPAAQPGVVPDKPTLKASSQESKNDDAEGTSVVISSSTDKAKPAPNASRSSIAVAETDTPDDRDSDAETIVLPGKDGHSPSKVRKVKHEDNSDADDSHAVGHRKRRDTEPSKDASEREKIKAASDGFGKKKTHRADRDSLRPDKSLKNQDGSSGLSSAPTSPPNRRRPPHAAGHDSDSDAERKRSPRLSNKDRAKSTDQLVSHKRKASRAASDDEHAEDRKAARRRRLEDRPDWTASGKEKSTPKEARSVHRDAKPLGAKWSQENNKGARSVSPPARAHRRSISTQLPAHSANGLSHKKKRLPPPLRSTEYQSDDSSASGNPHPRNAKVRNISTPATADSNMSPAKMPSSKRHVDAHGQTPLARACTKGEFEVAKQRLGERPDDIDFADYAGNTPLQSAAINGFEDIVELLINAGCNVDCVNDQKDTPLLDAVENGHLGVVKLLLAAGVNPRKANLQGEEPLDRIGDDLDNAADIRAALVEAKQRRSGTRKTSEDLHQTDHHDGKSSHGADSPRHSPAPIPVARRPGTMRSQKIGNHHLYVNLDEKTLRAAAARGDEETVTRVLQVKDGCDDPEAMVAAAKGGHDVVLQLLLALGSADPDPAPIPTSQGEPATPMLAAIGQENIKVVQLLLSQAKFDPTRKYRGMTYHEIARQKQGTNWKEEEQMLKDAFDAYKKQRGNAKTKSPRRERVRAQERDTTLPTSRSIVKDEPRDARRNLPSPARDVEGKKKSISRNVTSPKEKRRSQSLSQHEEQTSPKRGQARAKKDDRPSASAVSDRESSPAASQKPIAKPKKPDSDLAALSSEGETVKPRRKLVSKGELRGEREKHRRASMASNTSSLRDPPSPREPRPDDAAEKTNKEPLSEKYHDRTKALKRDESRERSAGDMPGKRHRSSVTPPHSSTGEKDSTDGPVKRRRLDAEGKERRIKSSESHDDRQKPTREGSHKSKPANRDDDGRKTKTAHDPELHPKGAAKPPSVDKSSIHVKSEEIDTEMPDAPSHDEAKSQREAEDEERRKKAEDEHKQRLAEDKRREEVAKQKEAEKRQREEEEARRRQEEEARKHKEEEDQRRAEEEARLKREAEEAKRLEAEAQRAREEEEARKRAEEEKARLEEERKLKEEEEQRLRDEEERLRKQQLEREAAEQARRQREEDERQERELRERQKREEAERKRAAHEAEVRRVREEERQQRVAKLPPLLRWLDGCSDPQDSRLAEKFRYMMGVRYDTIHPETRGTPEGREQWVSNHNVALFLGLKDLTLSRFTAWERVPVPFLAKKAIWMVEADRYALLTGPTLELGAQLPDYQGHDHKKVYHHPNTRLPQQLRDAASALYYESDMFLVKLSDLLYHIPSFPHLQKVELIVGYKEVPQPQDAATMQAPNHWRTDPDAARYHGFAPGGKYFLNGVLHRENNGRPAETSPNPFPVVPVPRRGLERVYPNDPDYARICREQGLEHLLSGDQNQKIPSLLNGVHPSPPMSHEEAVPETATTTPPPPSRADGMSQVSDATNGES